MFAKPKLQVFCFEKLGGLCSLVDWAFKSSIYFLFPVDVDVLMGKVSA